MEAGAGDPRGIQSSCLIMQICEVRKDKADLELNLAGDVRGNKTGLFKCISRKRKPREKVVLLLSREGDLVKNYAEETEVLLGFFVSAFTVNVGLHNAL